MVVSATSLWMSLRAGWWTLFEWPKILKNHHTNVVHLTFRDAVTKIYLKKMYIIDFKLVILLRMTPMRRTTRSKRQKPILCIIIHILDWLDFIAVLWKLPSNYFAEHAGGAAGCGSTTVFSKFASIAFLILFGTNDYSVSSCKYRLVTTKPVFVCGRISPVCHSLSTWQEFCKVWPQHIPHYSSWGQQFLPDRNEHEGCEVVIGE